MVPGTYEAHQSTNDHYFTKLSLEQDKQINQKGVWLKKFTLPPKSRRLEGAAGGRTALAGLRAPAWYSWAKKTGDLQRRAGQSRCHSEGRQGAYLRPGAVLWLGKDALDAGHPGIQQSACSRVEGGWEGRKTPAAAPCQPLLAVELPRPSPPSMPTSHRHSLLPFLLLSFGNRFTLVLYKL